MRDLIEWKKRNEKQDLETEEINQPRPLIRLRDKGHREIKTIPFPLP